MVDKQIKKPDRKGLVEREVEPALLEWIGKHSPRNPDQTPKIVFHGATSDREPFARASGIWFSSEPSIASAYVSARSTFMSARGELPSGNVYPAYIRMENPMIVDANGERWDEIEIDNCCYTTDDLIDMAREQGFDGLIVQNVNDLGGVVDNDDEYPLATTYAVLDVSQIRSIFAAKSEEMSNKNEAVTEQGKRALSSALQALEALDGYEGIKKRNAPI